MCECIKVPTNNCSVEKDLSLNELSPQDPRPGDDKITLELKAHGGCITDELKTVRVIADVINGKVLNLALSLLENDLRITWTALLRHRKLIPARPQLPKPSGALETQSVEISLPSLPPTPETNNAPFNYGGILMGPDGMMQKVLEWETGCKIMLRSPDTCNFKKLDRNQTGSRPFHTEDQVLTIETTDAPNRVKIKLDYAKLIIDKMFGLPEIRDRGNEMSRKEMRKSVENKVSELKMLQLEFVAQLDLGAKGKHNKYAMEMNLLRAILNGRKIYVPEESLNRISKLLDTPIDAKNVRQQCETPRKSPTPLTSTPRGPDNKSFVTPPVNVNASVHGMGQPYQGRQSAYMPMVPCYILPNDYWYYQATTAPPVNSHGCQFVTTQPDTHMVVQVQDAHFPDCPAGTFIPKQHSNN